MPKVRMTYPEGPSSSIADGDWRFAAHLKSLIAHFHRKRLAHIDHSRNRFSISISLFEMKTQSFTVLPKMPEIAVQYVDRQTVRYQIDVDSLEWKTCFKY